MEICGRRRVSAAPIPFFHPDGGARRVRPAEVAMHICEWPVLRYRDVLMLVPDLLGANYEGTVGILPQICGLRAGVKSLR